MNLERIIPKLEAMVPKVDANPVYFNANPDSVNAGALATKNRLKIYDPKESYRQGHHVGTIVGVLVGLFAVATLGKGL